MHWPEIGVLVDDLDYSEASAKQNMFNAVQQDPLMVATHFSRRFDALMKFIINGDQQPLGKVQDYFIRIEFQNRGSPHYHIIFWIEGVPKNIDNQTAPALKTYIEKVIHTNLPGINDDAILHALVSRLQTHRHTKYCQPRPSSQCRFKFPKQPCSTTRILSHGETVRRRGRYYETIRDTHSAYINPYNPTILKHWRANMDIQVINHAESVAYYICAYICKSEPDELKTALSTLITKTFPSLPTTTLRQRLWKIGTTVLKHRRLSAQEASCRLGNIPLIRASRKIVYLNTRVPDKRYRRLMTNEELDALPDNSTDIFLPNIIEYYRDRPDNISDISLFTFASNYERAPPLKNPSHHRVCPRIFLPNFGIYFKKRQIPCVVRYPQFPVTTDDFYYGLLILLLPHRTENELLHPYATSQEAFVNKANLFDKLINHTNFNFTSQIDNAVCC